MRPNHGVDARNYKKIIGKTVLKKINHLKRFHSKMYNKDKNIVGIGCDFQSENDDNSSRKLAIENLSGGEKKNKMDG